MTAQSLANKLISSGIIERIRVNRYLIKDTPYARSICPEKISSIINRDMLLETFGVMSSSGWVLRSNEAVLSVTYNYLDGRVQRVDYPTREIRLEELPEHHYWATGRSPVYHVNGVAQFSDRHVCLSEKVERKITFHYLDGSERVYWTDNYFILPPIPGDHRWVMNGQEFESGSHARFVEDTVAEEISVQRLNRRRYHSSGSGVGRKGVEEALARIANDDDGVRRSYGLEWEIYSLTSQQESALVSLLETLPSHVTEQDGSLSSSGVEIIFNPMSEEVFKDTWNKLQTFCRDNHVEMRGTGAHTTFGVSNSTIRDMDDLQIRLSRCALAVRAVALQSKIKEVFGRDFTNRSGYAHLPDTSLRYREHSNAFSASRGTSAFECRLCAWEGKVDKIVQFLRTIEFVFTRTFTAQDFIKIFEIFGSDCSQE